MAQHVLIWFVRIPSFKEPSFKLSQKWKDTFKMKACRGKIIAGTNAVVEILKLITMGYTLSMNVGRRGGRVKEGFKSAATIYCLNALGRGSHQGAKIAVILIIHQLCYVGLLNS